MKMTMRAFSKTLVAAAAWIALTGCSGGPSEGTCVTNQDCPTDQICVGGSCLGASPLGCRNDDACAVGEYCDLGDGVCKVREVVGCSTDAECPRNQRCNTLTQVCIDGSRTCVDDTTCAAIGQLCEPTTQQCVDCYEPSHCTAPTMCIANQCQDPSGGCVLDTDCNPPGTVCEGGACVPGCSDPRTPIPCGLGTVCNTTNGRCEAGNVTCQDDNECSPPNTVCESGQCIPGCGQVGGLQCTGGATCNPGTGRCETSNTCTDDTECAAPATICEAGVCVSGCGQPGGLACNAGTVCDTNTGRCVTVSGPCGSDAECGPPTTVCESGQCIGGCGQVGGIQCSGNTVCNQATGRCDAGGMVCMSDQDCAPPSPICNRVTGACDPGCITTGCPAMETCNQTTGYCQGGTPVGTQPLNSACTADSDCQSGQCFDLGQNIGPRCISSCGSHSDCPGSFTCYDYFGGKMCVSSQLFSGATFATQNGGACTAGGDCNSNYCPGNTCTGLCSEDGDCGGAACHWYEFTADRYIGACNGPSGAGTNGSSCTQESDCRSGVCYGSGICGDLCGSTADCPNGNVCAPVNFSVCTVDVIFSCLLWEPNFVKACVQSAHGQAANGTACADANGSNCRDGFCNATSNVCTGVCSRDSDCPSTMRCAVEEFGDLDGQAIYVNACR